MPFKFDLGIWAFATAVPTLLEADPSLYGFVKNASVVGSVVGAAWLVEARIGKKIGSAIKAHTDVEDEWRIGLEKLIATEFKHVNEKLDGRPCAAKCDCK